MRVDILPITGIVSLCVLAGACGMTASPGAAGGSGDSSGVVIVENSGALPAGLEIAAIDSPTIRIGQIEGDSRYELFQVRGVAELSDGRIAVLNGGGHEVLFYDREGRFITSVGRQGSGPGEFQFPVGMIRADDTLTVIDMFANRLTDIAPDFRVLRTRTVPVPLSGFVAFLDSSTFVAAQPPSLRNLGEGVFDMPYVVRVIVLREGTADTLGTFGGRREMQSYAGEYVMATPVPFTVYPQVRVRGGDIYILEGSTPKIDVYDRHGVLLRSIRLSRDARPVTASDYKRFVDERIDEISALPSTSELAAHRSNLRKIYDQMPRPDHFACLYEYGSMR